jgi:Tfp pilus assembly protein PilF
MDYTKRKRVLELIVALIVIVCVGVLMWRVYGSVDLYSIEVKEDYLEKKVLEDGDNLSLLSKLTEVYIGQGKIVEAERVLAIMESVSADSQQVEYARGNYYAAIGEFEKAKRLLNASILESPSSDAYVKLGSIYLKEGHLQESELLFRKALEIDNSSFSAFSGLGYLYFLEGDHFLAKSMLSQSLELNPYSSQSYVNLGYVYLNENDTARAKELFERALVLNRNSARAYMGMGSLYNWQGDLKNAEEMFRKAVNIDPHRVNAHLSLARIYSELGKEDKSKEHLELAKIYSPREYEKAEDVG